jgi:putative membrane protein
MMLYPSLSIALRVVPRQSGGRTRYYLLTAGIGAIVMVAWDLVLDPLMVAHGYWTWSEVGPYFGIPFSNFIGWWVTSFIILLAFLTLARIPSSSMERLRGRFGGLPVISYGVTGLISVVVALDIGLIGPSLAAVFGMLPWFVSGYWGRAQALG